MEPGLADLKYRSKPAKIRTEDRSEEHDCHVLMCMPPRLPAGVRDTAYLSHRESRPASQGLPSTHHRPLLLLERASDRLKLTSNCKTSSISSELRLETRSAGLRSLQYMVDSIRQMHGQCPRPLAVRKWQERNANSLFSWLSQQS